MGFLSALKVFHRLSEKGIFEDYAIGGAIAVNYYTEPRNTQDLDLYFLIDDKGYHLLWETLRSMGYKAKGQRVIVEEVPVDMFPVSIHPIYEEALQKAIRVKVDGITVKIFSPEYLMVTKLMAFRERDRGDISDLFQFSKVNMNLLRSIIRRYDDEKSFLHKRLQEILGRSGKAR